MVDTDGSSWSPEVEAELIASCKKLPSLKQSVEFQKVTELETALLDGCDFGILRNICKGEPVPSHLRPEVWKICLNLVGKNNTLSSFNGLFNLPEQSAIRQESQNLVDTLGNDEEDKVVLVSDLEEIVTFYSKAKNTPYEADCGWLSLIQPTLALKLSKNELYNVFYAIISKYIPRDCRKGGSPFNLFRLLLQYHDPRLCSFLDTKRITPDMYAQHWFCSLFADACDLDVILSMWDVYFQQADPFLMFFLALVILVNSKDDLVEMETNSKQAIADKLSILPASLEAEDIKDFCDLAQHYASKTPQSFRRDYHNPMFNQAAAKETPDHVSQALCLLVSVGELLQANALGAGEGVRYFVVDCRPAEQYNSGHLPTAFHLDAGLMLQNPAEFATAVTALFAAQQQAISVGAAAGGEHLCFLGSGRDEEDQYVHMVVANFLQKHSLYVSVAKDGYAAIHQALEDDLSTGLTGHAPKSCIVCNPDVGHVTSDSDTAEHFSSDKKESFMAKLSVVRSVVKEKSSLMKDRFIDYIKNESGPERHVSSLDKGKPYRNIASVFSIGDDDEDDLELSGDEKEVVSVELWKDKPEVNNSFKCDEIKDNGFLYPSWLLVTDTHLYVLREISDKKGLATIQNRTPLEQIIKITSKKKHPELITFRYGTHTDSSSSVTGSDKFIIPDAGGATKAIKYAIMKIIDAAEAT